MSEAIGATSGLRAAFRDVLIFNRKFGIPIAQEPEWADEPAQELRQRLIAEEYRELCVAFHRGGLEDLADAGIDLIYVILGMFSDYGIDPGPLWEAVQAANMAKEGGGKREDGKILKPPGWVPPDIMGAIVSQRPLSELYPTEVE